MIKIKTLPDPIINYDLENVYTPSEDTYLIIDYFKRNIDYDYFDGMNIREVKKILDLGTGTGILAVIFQLIKKINPNFNPEIYASDILEEVIKCAKLNEKLNNFENEIKFIQSDLLKSFPETLKHSFDIIVFNPPYLPSSKLIDNKEIKTNIDYSWNGGKKGIEVFLRFLDEVKVFLKKKFHIYYISSSRTNLQELNKFILQKGFKNKILNKKHLFFEDIILNRLEINNI